MARTTAPRRPVAAAPNLLDRLAGAISPKWGARRLMQRQALAAVGLSGGYSGASRGRAALRNFSPGAQDADGDLIPDLPELRERSRDLERNNPLGKGALSAYRNNVVGTGLTCQPQPDFAALGITREAAQAWGDAAAREWRLFCDSTNADVRRELNFYGLQALAFHSALVNGDVLAILTDKPAAGHPYTLAVQLVEADRVCNADRAIDSAERVAGVHLDADGAAIAFDVASRHPEQILRFKPLTWKRVAVTPTRTGRVNVKLLKHVDRIGQTRGAPLLAPVIEPLKQLSRLTEAELQAAVISGMFAVFVKMDPEAFETLFADDARNAYIESTTKWDGTVDGGSSAGPGKAVNLLPGEEIDAASPGRPNPEFDPFFQAIVRQIGVGVDLPFEILIKHFTSSYSAARAAMLDAWRVFRIRRTWLADNFCQWVYEAVIEEGVATRRLAAPGFFSDIRVRRAYVCAQWIGDAPGSIDPAKEVQAAKERVALGISTRAAESVAYDGVDWLPKHRQLVEEERLRREAGLGDLAPGTAAGGQGGGRQAGADPEDHNGDNADPADGNAGASGVAGSALATIAPVVQAVPQVLGAMVDTLRALHAANGERDERFAALAERLTDLQVDLGAALVEAVREPVRLESKVELVQADNHIHMHAAPPVATHKIVRNGPDGEILAVTELPIGADQAATLVREALAQAEPQAGAASGAAAGAAEGA